MSCLRHIQIFLRCFLVGNPQNDIFWFRITIMNISLHSHILVLIENFRNYLRVLKARILNILLLKI